MTAADWPAWTTAVRYAPGPPGGLTERQAAALAAIADHVAVHGYAPTLRELMRALGIASPNGIVCHLKALVRKGYITRDGGMARSIRLSDRALAYFGRAPGEPATTAEADDGEKEGEGLQVTDG
jgi:SOS-response transcriptional repressor LexA